MLDYLFLDRGKHRVVADCDVRNAPVIALLERLVTKVAQPGCVVNVPGLIESASSRERAAISEPTTRDGADAAGSLQSQDGYCSGSASGSCCSLARRACSRSRLPTTRVKTTLVTRPAITTPPAMVPIIARPSGLFKTTPLR